MTKYATLASITDVLLDPTTTPQLRRDTIEIYRDLLLTASGVDLGDAASVDHVDTGKGVAIGMTWAALCVDDMIRTQRFVTGLHRAIQDVAARRGGPVHVLYAGTGPFVTLALPLMTRFTPQQLQFTCIEINPASLRAAQRVIQQLGFEDFIADFIEADAATYVIDTPRPIDIVLSETMQYCLIDEMQVPITLNLMAQLPEETILIPEQIRLSLVVLDEAGDKIVAELGPIFSVDKNSLRIHSIGAANADFPTVRLPVPIHVPPAKLELTSGPLAIRTGITVYGEEVLYDYDSGLTIPKIIGDYPSAEDPLEAIDFTYHLAPSPLLWMDFVVPEAVAAE
ncbi:hypothetical protein LEM8419_02428 [Neolewinella maritima]|uniref:PRMT5 arginine-N-methyltransferase domain-containing protein n=1 Tax=Neolewinella maritima TaxID=1383882 RepID=A0ABN8FAE9_9BACT|nr:hypothetical protein [Neolewinella maritima]CAH1001525.1 hypothetical protein LEM8419_02428 [Neolewinella maritima]